MLRLPEPPLPLSTHLTAPDTLSQNWFLKGGEPCLVPFYSPRPRTGADTSCELSLSALSDSLRLHGL